VGTGKTTGKQWTNLLRGGSQSHALKRNSIRPCERQKKEQKPSNVNTTNNALWGRGKRGERKDHVYKSTTLSKEEGGLKP